MAVTTEGERVGSRGRARLRTKGSRAELISTDAIVRPFLKWAGGKNRSASIIASLAPTDGFDTYIEPFCGSAAVFFAVGPQRAVLADANDDLVMTLRAVRHTPYAVMAQLDLMRNTKAAFDKVRKMKPNELTYIQRAARLIYLNKTAFRGLWRVNRSGEFNTPYGQYDRPYYNPDTILAASTALRAADVRCADFEDVLGEARRGDWVYLDPPYVPDRKWGDFTRYTAGQFGREDHERLARALQKLDSRGVRWLLTNSNTPVTREIYAGYRMASLATRRDITLASADRDSTDLVVANYGYAPSPTLKALPSSRA